MNTSCQQDGMNDSTVSHDRTAIGEIHYSEAPQNTVTDLTQQYTQECKLHGCLETDVSVDKLGLIEPALE